MLQLLTHGQNGMPLLVFGLSFKNVEELKKDNPILLDLEALGLSGSMAITAKNELGECAVPQVEDLMVMAVTHDDLDQMTGGKVLTVGFQAGPFKGEIIMFSAKDEHTMEQMFKNKEVGFKQGTTCAECGSAHREDGSCDCKETLQ